MCMQLKHRHVFSVAFSILLQRISEMFFSVRVDFQPFGVFKQDLNKNLLESGLPLSSRQHKQVNKKHVLHCPFLYYTCTFIYISVILIKEGHIHICDFNKRRAYKFTCCRPIKVMWVDPLTFTHISDRNPPLQQRDLHGNINIVF